MWTPEVWLKIGERLGIPALVLIMILLAVWVIIKWIARKVVEPLVTGHLGLIAALRNTTISNTKINETNSSTLRSLTTSVDKKAEALTQLAKNGEQTLVLIKENNSQVCVAIANQTRKLLEKMPGLNGSVHQQAEKAK